MLLQPSGDQPILVTSFSLFQDVVNCWVYFASVPDDWGRMHGVLLTGHIPAYMEKNVWQYHFVYHKTYMDWRGYWTRDFAMRVRPLTALFKTISSFFPSVFLSYSDLFYLLTAGGDGYCCIRSCSMTHTLTHTTPTTHTHTRHTHTHTQTHNKRIHTHTRARAHTNTQQTHTHTHKRTHRHTSHPPTHKHTHTHTH